MHTHRQFDPDWRFGKDKWQPGTPFSISKNDNWGTFADTYGGSGGFRVIQLGAKITF